MLLLIDRAKVKKAIAMDYSRAGLEAAHFKGFIPLKTLTRTDVLGPRGSADVEGVYMVLRSVRTRPEFIEDDHPAPRPPVMSRAEVVERWPEENPEILYIGKAGRSNGLASRLLQFKRCGFSGGTSHFGGRLVWRIADRDGLLVCWKCLPDDTAEDIESLMVAGFTESTQQKLPPFANTGGVKACPDQSLLPLIEGEGC